MPGEFAKALEWISIAEAALQWSREREDSPGVIEAVLYDYWERWCEEYGIDYDAEEWKFRDEARYADALFDLDDSWIDKPSADDILINRSFVEGFCSSQKMNLPKFWFAPERKDLQPSYPGRPSIMKAICHELRRRAEEGNLEISLAEQARVLSEWGERTDSDAQPPTPKTTENGIRKLYWELKGPPQN